MIKAVIFDYGGVVKEAQGLPSIITGGFKISEEDMSIIKDRWSPFVHQAEKGFIDDEQMYKEIFALIGKELAEGSVDLAKDYYRQTFRFILETLDLVDELKVRHIKVAVLSNIFKFEKEIIIEMKGYDKFDPVILSCDAGMRKPDLEIYKLALEKIGFKSEECIFVDDKEENLVPARQLGIATVLARTPKQVVEDVLNIIENRK